MLYSLQTRKRNGETRPHSLCKAFPARIHTVSKKYAIRVLIFLLIKDVEEETVHFFESVGPTSIRLIRTYQFFWSFLRCGCLIASFNRCWVACSSYITAFKSFSALSLLICSLGCGWLLGFCLSWFLLFWVCRLFFLLFCLFLSC